MSPTGTTQSFNKSFDFRVNDEYLAEIDEWRRQQPGLPSRAEAIRRLSRMGLEVDRAKGRKKKAA